MPLYIPDFYRSVVITHSLEGSTRPAVCTIGLEQDQAESSTDLEMAQYFGDNWVQHIMPQVTAQATLRSVKLARTEGVTAEAVFNVAGTRPGNSLTPNTAWLVKKVTGVAGRGHSGRMYIPGVPDAGADNNGVIPADTLAGWQAALDLFLAEFNNFEGIVGLRLLHNVVPPGEIGPPPDDIYALNIDPRVATQRRRLRK